MASAVDSRLAYARLSAVATASRLPTANRGSNNSYTTSWDTTGAGSARVTLAHNARDRAEVDALLAEAERAGATILKPAEDVFWGGYSGYFADPDGHAWEVAWNPHTPLRADGGFVLAD